MTDTEVEILIVSYKNVEAFGVDFALNVSRKVFFIAAEKPLSPGTPVKIGFEIPGLRLPFAIDGVVRWTSHPAASGKPSPGMGVELTGLGQARQAIESYLDEAGRSRNQR